MKYKVLASATTLFLISGNLLADVPPSDSDAGKERQILVHTYMNKHPGVSVDQAITRLAVQEELGQAFAELRGEFSDRLSAISLQHEPDQHILVELTGQGPVPDRTALTRSGSTRVTFETGNAHTSKEFYDILDRNNALIYSLIPGVTGISGYPGDNRLVILIKGDAALADSLRTSVRTLERVMGFNIDIEPSHPRSTNIEHVVSGAVL
jgi:hypothetical protein